AVPPMGARKTASSTVDDEPYLDDDEIEAMSTHATFSTAPLGMLEPVLESSRQAAPRKAQSVKQGIASPPATSPVALPALAQSVSTALPAAPVAAAMPLPAPLHPQPSKGEPSELALEILTWLRNGLASGALLHNVKDATVHFVEEGLLLVSPRFFRDFATAQIDDAASADPASAITDLEKRAQKALVQAGWTLKAANNQNIIAYQIGQSEKTLSGMVIERSFAESRIVVMGYNNVLLRRKEAAAKMPLMQDRSSTATKAMPGTKAGAKG
ncbi:MAG: DNA-binding domain-containing protein, partial [Betaproteobacteria bacterium]|nr:DNA-binding domain-containing protein [Betaproteobacteria bacterium]